MKILIVFIGIGGMLVSMSAPALAEGNFGRKHAHAAYHCKSGHVVRHKGACKEFGGRR